MRLARLIQILGYLGLVPFLVPIWFVLNHQSLLGLSPSRLFVVYSGVILTFLAGSIWGTIVNRPLNSPANYAEPDFRHVEVPIGLAASFAVISNLIALSVWLVILISDNYDFAALFALLTGFVIVLWMELGWNLQYSASLKNKYLSLRWKLTLIVTTCHIVMLFLTY